MTGAQRRGEDWGLTRGERPAGGRVTIGQRLRSFIAHPPAPLLLCAVTLLAAALRLYGLDHLPPGLYHDEAFNGLDALSILQGRLPLFFEANNGREPLFIYLTALGVAALGRTPGALRIASALVGALTVPALYALARALCNRRVALITAWLAATLVWTLNLSRVAFRVVTLPLVAAMALALLWSGLSRRSALRMAWAGVALGLCLYTYLAAPLGLLAVALFALYLWGRERGRFWWRGWLLLAACTLAAALPLAVYHLNHWGSLTQRAGQVSLLNPAIGGGDVLAALFANLRRTALAFLWRGDYLPRHNVPGRAIFDPFTGAAFLLGLGLAAARARREAAWALCLLWLAVLLLPTVLAEEAPHMLRMAGVLPVLLIFPALGLEWLWQRLRRPAVQWAGGALLALGLVASAAGNVAALRQHLQSPSAFYGYEVAAVELAADVNRFLGTGWQGEGLSAPQGPALPGRVVYLAAPLWEKQAAVRYLCAESPAIRLLDPEAPAPPALAGSELLLLAPPEQDEWALSLLPRERLLQIWRGSEIQIDREPAPHVFYRAYACLQAGAAPHNAGLRWSQGVELVGYRLDSSSPGELVLDLYWRTAQPLPASYNVFAHVLRQGVLAAQHDGAPAGGLYPTDRWRVGDIVLDEHRIPLTSPFDPSTDQIGVGLYRWENMEHLTLLDATGAPTEETRARLPWPPR